MTAKTPEKDQPTSILLPMKQRTLLRNEAKKQDLTVSQLIRRIIQAWFDFNSKNRGNLDPDPKEKSNG